MKTRAVSLNRLSSGQIWLLTLSLGFLAFYTAGLIVRPGEGYLQLQSNFLYNVASIVALVLVLRRARKAKGLERWGWCFLAATLTTWLTGDLVYSYYDQVLGSEVPFPGVADIFYTFGYASLLLALPLLTYPHRLVGNLRWVLDVMLIMTVVGSFEWVLIIQPILDESGTSTWESLLALSYPLWDLGLITVIVGGMLAWHGNLAPQSKVLLAAMAAQALTDSFYSYGLFDGSYENVGNPLEVGWLLAYLLIGFAATMPSQSEPVRFERRLPLFWMIFPYLLALPLPIVQAVRASSRANLDVLSLGAAAVLLMAFLSHVHGSYMTTRALEDERRKARLDSLTGTLNHGGIVEEAEALIAANPNAKLTVCMADLDGLKRVNDVYGHPTGDQALKVIASRLRRSGGIVGRYGGDEFLVLFEPHTELEGPSPELLMRHVLTGAFIDDGEGAELPVSASFGFSVYPDEATDLSALIEKADDAMYAQKREKRQARGQERTVEPTTAPLSPRAA
jgi:diguanylate cyclase (GGDEF)-like protein